MTIAAAPSRRAPGFETGQQPKPDAPPVQFETIPIALKEAPRWVLWRYEMNGGKWTKIPYRARGGKASSTDPESWAPFAAAQAVYERGRGATRPYDGIGFVLSGEDDLVGIDLDHCLNDGRATDDARAIVRLLDSYTEVTPSGEGLRVFVRGSLPPGRRKRGNVECYEHSRFLTVTGIPARSGADTIEKRSDALAEFHARYLGLAEVAATPPPPRPLPAIHLADAELVARMRAAANGERVWALWSGDLAGYASPSEGDLALCNHLAFWTAGNPARMDAMFRQSARMRDKWDSYHGERTYGQLTIAKALLSVTAFYDPDNAAGTAPRIRLRVRPGEPEPDESQPLALTDMGNAQRLVARYGHLLHYCHPWNKWLAWDGTRWRIDDTGAVVRFAKATSRAIFQEAAEARSDDQARALSKWANRSQAEARLGSMVALAQSEPDVPVVPEHLDADPWLLNVQNGMLDLRTGELQPHDRDMLVTKLAPVSYDPHATCPTWLTFLNQVMGDQTEMVAFLQRAVGYSMTGSTRERALFLAYGTGANGKSTFLETLRAMCGDYAMKTPTDTLLAKSDAGIPNDVARLKGARFVAASESDEGRRLAESMVKAMTGSDTLSARFMRGEWFDFKPEFKLWLATNHKPTIRGTDKGIWDRIKVIPFLVRIEDDKQDRELHSKLLAELPGILAWAVRGCLAWQRDGLSIPRDVVAATDAYREEQDILAAFLVDRCVIQASASARASELYTEYKQWCDTSGEHPQSQRRFGSALAERGFQRVHGRHGWVWNGLGLAGDDPERDPLEDPVSSHVTLGDPNSLLALREKNLLEVMGNQGHKGSRVTEAPPSPWPTPAVRTNCKRCYRALLNSQLAEGYCADCGGPAE